MLRIFVILSILSTQLLAGPSCDDLRKDLLAIEYKIQMSELHTCSPDNPEKEHCKNPEGDDHDEKRYGEVEAEYNKALANLILAEGLVAIGQSVSGSYNKLAAIKETELTKAQKYIDVLKLNLDKAEIVEAALTPVSHALTGDNGQVQNNTASFRYKYSDIFAPGLGIEEFDKRLQNLCDGEGKSEVLCLELKRLSTDAKFKPEYVKTLHGLFDAERNSREFPGNDPTKEFEHLKKYLKLRVDKNSPSISAKEFREKFYENADGNRPSIKEMENSLIGYMADKTPENAGHVFDMARRLDSVDVSYQNIVSENEDKNSNTLPGAYKDFYKKEFSAPLDALEVEPTDRIITDIWKKNLDHQVDYFSNQAKLLKSGRSTAASLGILEAKDSTPAMMGANTDEVAKQFETMANTLKQAQDCYERDTLEEKKICIKDVIDQNNLPVIGTIGELRKKVSKAQDNLNFYNNGKPFKQYKVIKGLALSALERKNCHKDGDLYNVKKFNCQADLELKTSPVFLDLGENMADIQIKMDEDWATSAYRLKNDEKVEEFRARRDHFMNEKCEGVDSGDKIELNYYRNICDYYQSDKAEREAYVNELRARKKAEEQRDNRAAMARKYQIEKKGPSKASIITKSASSVLAYSIPGLITSKIEYDQTKQWRNYSLKSIELKQNAYNNYMSELKACQADPINGCSSFQYQMAANHGFNLMANGYYNQGNFQSGYTNNIYSNNTGAYSYNFATAIDSNMKVIAPITNTTTDTSVYNFNF